MADHIEPLSGTENVTLELAKTGLRVVGPELQRTNKNGGVVLRLPIRTVQAVECAARFDPFSLVFVTVGCGLAAIAYLVSENNALTTLLYVAALVFAGFGILGSRSHWIVIRSATGVIDVRCNDEPDESEGFALSVRNILSEQTGST